MIINNVYQHIDVNYRVYQLPTLNNLSNKGKHNIDDILSNIEMHFVISYSMSVIVIIEIIINSVFQHVYLYRNITHVNYRVFQLPTLNNASNKRKHVDIMFSNIKVFHVTFYSLFITSILKIL